MVYINALNALNSLNAFHENKFYSKTWEDVLDVIVRLRFSSGVTVLDLGTLMREYLERNQGKLLAKLVI